MDWLASLVEQHSELESPKNFWLWAGICTISAVLKDSVWLNRGGVYNLYPNIYCILHADSGLKKGPPINLAKDLIKRVNNTRLISGRSSVQGILKELGTAYSMPGGRVIMKSVGTILSSELSASLVTDPSALTILTDLYDRNYNEGEWKSLLKMESFELKDPTVTLFGGINEAHAESFFDKKDIQGGFYARTFFIYEKEEQVINSLVRRISKPLDKNELVKHLKEIAKLEGPFEELSDEKNKPTEVGAFYENWYDSFRREIKVLKIKDDTGTLNRLGDSVLKVAMILSLAKGVEKRIDLESMHLAIKLCESLVGNIRRTTLGKRGMSNQASHKALIINELLNREPHSITRQLLLKKYWMHFNAVELDEIMAGFDASGMIKVINEGTVILYEMPKKQSDELKAFLAGKNQ